jgi:16S rRNA (cytosine967-C5)-methyltransferase
VATLRENLRRLRRPLPVFVGDAAAPPVGARFDRVLLDLPCSGTGTLRKNPELKWRLSEREIGRLAAQAEQMLASGARCVAPGGVLVAITCSIEREENEAVGERFLAAHADFAALPLTGLDHALAAGVEAPGRWRVLPGDDHDGFTVQVFVREKAH